MKKLIKLNENMNTMIKNVKLAELITKIATAFLNTQSSKINLLNTNVYFVIRVIKKSLMKTKKNDFFNKYNFSNHDINRFILLLAKVVYPY